MPKTTHGQHKTIPSSLSSNEQEIAGRLFVEPDKKIIVYALEFLVCIIVLLMNLPIFFQLDGAS